MTDLLMFVALVAFFFLSFLYLLFRYQDKIIAFINPLIESFEALAMKGKK